MNAVTTPDLITPPPEMFAEWLASARRMYPQESVGLVAGEVARFAYRAGADMELEACVAWLLGNWPGIPTEKLRAARRPKPLTLAEQATAELDEAVMRGDCITTTDAMPLLRAALKRLAELEAAQ